MTTTQDPTPELRMQALAQHLGCEVSDIREESRCFAHLGFSGWSEYSVRTNDEATEAARAYLKDGLWSLDYDFILPFTCMRFHSDHERKRCQAAFKEMNDALCEDANPVWTAL